MSRKLDNEFSPFEDVWADVDMQKEDITEQNGKKTVITVKNNSVDLSKVVLQPKGAVKNEKK